MDNKHSEYSYEYTLPSYRNIVMLFTHLITLYVCLQDDTLSEVSATDSPNTTMTKLINSSDKEVVASQLIYLFVAGVASCCLGTLMILVTVKKCADVKSGNRNLSAQKSLDKLQMELRHGFSGNSTAGYGYESSISVTSPIKHTSPRQNVVIIAVESPPLQPMDKHSIEAVQHSIEPVQSSRKHSIRNREMHRYGNRNGNDPVRVTAVAGSTTSDEDVLKGSYGTEPAIAISQDVGVSFSIAVEAPREDRNGHQDEESEQSDHDPDRDQEQTEDEQDQIMAKIINVSRPMPMPIRNAINGQIPNLLDIHREIEEMDGDMETLLTTETSEAGRSKLDCPTAQTTKRKYLMSESNEEQYIKKVMENAVVIDRVPREHGPAFSTNLFSIADDEDMEYGDDHEAEEILRNHVVIDDDDGIDTETLPTLPHIESSSIISQHYPNENDGYQWIKMALQQIDEQEWRRYLSNFKTNKVTERVCDH